MSDGHVNPGDGPDSGDLPASGDGSDSGELPDSSHMSDPGDLPAPSEVLPHAPPFLFLDAVTELVPAESAKGFWQLTGEEPFFAGHFPGRPTLPGVLMVESLAQLGAYLVLQEPRYAGKLPLFGGLGRVRFRRQVEPGEKLDLSVEVIKLSAISGRAQGLATVNDEKACEAELMFVLVSP